MQENIENRVKINDAYTKTLERISETSKKLFDEGATKSMAENYASTLLHGANMLKEEFYKLLDGELPQEENK